MVLLGVFFPSIQPPLLFMFHTLPIAYASRIKASVDSPINLLVEHFGTGSSGLLLITKDDTLRGSHATLRNMSGTCKGSQS